MVVLLLFFQLSAFTLIVGLSFFYKYQNKEFVMKNLMEQISNAPKKQDEHNYARKYSMPGYFIDINKVANAAYRQKRRKSLMLLESSINSQQPMKSEASSRKSNKGVEVKRKSCSPAEVHYSEENSSKKNRSKSLFANIETEKKQSKYELSKIPTIIVKKQTNFGTSKQNSFQNTGVKNNSFSLHLPFKLKLHRKKIPQKRKSVQSEEKQQKKKLTLEEKVERDRIKSIVCQQRIYLGYKIVASILNILKTDMMLKGIKRNNSSTKTSSIPRRPSQLKLLKLERDVKKWR